MKPLTDIPHLNFVKNNLAFDRHYQYQILTKEYVDQTVQVFTQAFCRSEPMTAYLKMDEDRYSIFARSVVLKAVEDQMSVIALDNGNVIACALNEDIADPGEIPDFDSKFKYILALLESLGQEFFLNKLFAKQEMAHLFITAVAKNYRHQGISTQVNFHAMDLAAYHQFNAIYCEFTHHFNEYGVIHHLKNAKRLIGKAIYDDFVVDGKKPFSALQHGAHSFLWDISGRNSLKYQENDKLIVEPIALTKAVV